MPRRRRTYTSPQEFKQQTLLDFLSSSHSSSPSKSFPRSRSPGASKRKRTRTVSGSSSSHSDRAQETDSDVCAIRLEPEANEISDEDHSSPRRPKKTGLMGAHAIPERTAGYESFDEVIEVPWCRKGKKKVVLDSEDDTRPRKRKLIRGIRPPTPEEDDDILDAGNRVLENRLRSRGKVTVFQRNLEKLKMLKGKKRGEIVLESSSEGEQSEGSAVVPFKGAKQHHSGDSGASQDEIGSSDDDDDDDFIVDDDTHGVPVTQLPPAFSLSTHQDLTHHFKIVCQLFVHMAVQPLVDRRSFLERALKEEEYLSVPLQVTRRKLDGLRDSLVASSIWRSSFKRVLETYPKFTLVRLDFTIPQCDACHLGGRSSTLLGRLSGKQYDKFDFENVSDNESDESLEKNEKDKDSDGDGERDSKAEFHLGRFCAARTRVYHQFSHWEYSLYKSLQREILEAQDETRGFVKVAYFGGIKPPRDLQDADRMMEWLDERGVIDVEWHKVRQMMESAHNLERGEIDDM